MLRVLRGVAAHNVRVRWEGSYCRAFGDLMFGKLEVSPFLFVAGYLPALAANFSTSARG